MRWEYEGSRYRWQRVCHDGECELSLEVPWGMVCPKCYPFAHDTQGEVIWIEGECDATVHTDTRYLGGPQVGEIEHCREGLRGEAWKKLLTQRKRSW